MSQVKQQFRHGLNRLLRPIGAELVPLWWQQQLRDSVSDGHTFEYLGKPLPFFLHHFNCGGHPLLASERTVELAIADEWLSAGGSQNVLEIGAVTPYYWPHRISRVADPYDSHPLVSERASVQEIDLQAKAVLSVSTFEHFGTGDYGLPRDDSLFAHSLQRLFDQAGRFLVTIPLGYNPIADQCVLSLQLPRNVAMTVLSRQPGPPFWSTERAPLSKRWEYCGGRANAVAVLQCPC